MNTTPFLARGVALTLLAGVFAGCAAVESRPPVTTEQVLQMSKAGVPAADIVQKMRDAGTVYRLSGSQLARLKSEGVDDEVLDYMQDTYLAAARARGAAEYGSYWGGAWAWGPYPWAWGPYPYGYWGPGYWRPYWGPYYRYPPHRYHRSHPAPPAAHPPSPPAMGPAPAPPRSRPAPHQQRN